VGLENEHGEVEVKVSFRSDREVGVRDLVVQERRMGVLGLKRGLRGHL